MTTTSPPDAGWPELLGAFAHEMRTPLATASMVLQLCNMSADEEGEVRLDSELVGMLHQSIATLVEMTDGLQEAARIVRGRLTIQREPVALAAALREAVGSAPQLSIDTDDLPHVEGLWDPTRLTRSLASLAAAANRAGANDGRVALSVTTAEQVELRMRSGILRGDETDADQPGAVSNVATLGVDFFFARLAIRSMGGEVTFRRGGQRCEICVSLPTEVVD